MKKIIEKILKLIKEAFEEKVKIIDSFYEIIFDENFLTKKGGEL